MIFFRYLTLSFSRVERHFPRLPRHMSIYARCCALYPCAVVVYIGKRSPDGILRLVTVFAAFNHSENAWTVCGGRDRAMS